MIKKALLRFGGAAALVALTASGAHALSFPYNNSNVCGGNRFQTCASLSVTFNATNNVATITITNKGPGVFTAFGFSSLPAGVTYTGTNNLAVPGRFEAGYQNEIQADGFGSTSPPGRTTTGLQVNESGTFVLTFSRTLTATELAALDFDIHSQAGPNNCSTKLEIAPNGSTSTTIDPACAISTVPEPVSMSLLATGLASMGGLGAFKRRRRAA